MWQGIRGKVILETAQNAWLMSTSRIRTKKLCQLYLYTHWDAVNNEKRRDITIIKRLTYVEIADMEHHFITYDANWKVSKLC